jgi:hypothetical protein
MPQIHLQLVAGREEKTKSISLRVREEAIDRVEVADEKHP